MMEMMDMNELFDEGRKILGERDSVNALVFLSSLILSLT